MTDKVNEDSTYFFDNHAYLELFRSLVEPTNPETLTEEFEPESLD